MKDKEKQNKGKKILKPLAIAGLSLAMACSVTACGKDKTGSKDPTTPIYWTAENAYAEAQSQGYEGSFDDFLKTLAGIKSATIDASGHLKLTLSDDSVVDAGEVKGAKGDTGATGATGVGVADILQETDRWGLKTTTTYVYTDSTAENPHTQVIEETRTPDFGRLYDFNNEEEFKYLVSCGVTSFALNNDVYLSSNVTLKAVKTGKNMQIIDMYGSEEVEESNITEGVTPTYINVKMNYIFDLNGYTFGTSSIGKLVVEDGVNVYFDNGKLGSSFEGDSFEFDYEESMLYAGENISLDPVMIISNAKEFEEAKDYLDDMDYVLLANSESGLRAMLDYAKTNNIDNLYIVIAEDIELMAQLDIKLNVTIDLNGRRIYNETNDCYIPMPKDDPDYGKRDTKTNSLISIFDNVTVIIKGDGVIASKENDAYAIDIKEGTLIIEGGEYVGNLSAIQVQKGELVIKGGTFSILQVDKTYGTKGMINAIDSNWKGGTAKMTIQGGTFKNFNPINALDGNLVAEGYKVVAESRDGATYYTVKKLKSSDVVQDENGFAYESLEDVIENISAGSTISLIKDIEVMAQVNITKDLKLNLNGHKIYNETNDCYIYETPEDPGTAPYKTKTNSLISIQEGANVTIYGDGTIAAKENDAYTIAIVKGTLTINGGNFVGNLTAVQVQDGTLTINGGNFSILQEDKNQGVKGLINAIDSNWKDGSAKINIYGGTFKKFNPCEANDGNLMSEGYKVEEKEEGGVKYYTVIEDTSKSAE